MDEVKTQSQKRKCLWRLFFFFFFDAGFVIDTGHKQTLRRFPFNPPWLIIDKAADSRASAVICRRTQRCLVRGFFLSSFFFLSISCFFAQPFFALCLMLASRLTSPFSFFFLTHTQSAYRGREKHTPARQTPPEREREREKRKPEHKGSVYSCLCVCELQPFWR